MSRYIIPALKETHKIIVGYDQPLSTFYANVEDLTLADEYDDPYIFQAGQHLHALPSVQSLAQVLSPYARLPMDMVEQLRADQEAPYQRSALQERMVQFFEYVRLQKDTTC